MSRSKALVCHNTALVSEAYCINAIPGLILLHEPKFCHNCFFFFFVFGYYFVLQFVVSFLALMGK